MIVKSIFYVVYILVGINEKINITNMVIIQIQRNITMTLISDSQIIVALVTALITGILALRLGKELSK